MEGNGVALLPRGGLAMLLLAAFAMLLVGRAAWIGSATSPVCVVAAFTLSHRGGGGVWMWEVPVAAQGGGSEIGIMCYVQEYTG